MQLWKVAFFVVVASSGAFASFALFASRVAKGHCRGSLYFSVFDAVRFCLSCRSPLQSRSMKRSANYVFTFTAFRSSDAFVDVTLQRSRGRFKSRAKQARQSRQFRTFADSTVSFFKCSFFKHLMYLFLTFFFLISNWKLWSH